MSLRLSLVAPLTGGLLSVALTSSAQPASSAPPTAEPSETVPRDAQPAAPEPRPPPPAPPPPGGTDEGTADGRPEAGDPRAAENPGSAAPTPPAPGSAPTQVPPPAGQPAAPPAAPSPYGAQPPYPHPYGYPYPYPRPPRIYRLPPVLPYEEGAPPPRGYRLRERLYKGMVIAGAVTFGSTWLLSAVSAAVVQSSGNEDDAEAFAPLFVPLAGPFVALGTTNANAFASFVLVVDGLAQIAGLGMLIHGAITPKHEWVLDQARLEITPFVTGQTAGLGARVTF